MKNIPENKGVPPKHKESDGTILNAMKEETIVNLAFNGLCTDGAHHKQYYLEQILKILRTDEEILDMKGRDSDGSPMYDWEEGTP